MNDILVTELNDLFVDTLERASMKLLSKSDEEIECQLFEDFDSGSHSFLHINTLEKLEKFGFINEEIKNLSTQLRRMSLKLLNGEVIRNADAVKRDESWHKVLKLSNKIRNLKLDLDNNQSTVL